MELNNIQAVTLGPHCPKIHSLLFADDLIICGQANSIEANRINSILNNFCNASGQTPNLAKSHILFSKNVDDSSKSEVRSIFPVNDLAPNSTYLGHPLIFNHNDRNKAYNFIIAKFRAKLTTIKANKLNHAGHLVYINSVLSSIPIYYMSTVMFSKKSISKITSIIRRFWWSGVQEENASSPFHFRSWDDICKPKDKGGLGIRDILKINQSLLINAAWNIVTNKNLFLSSILKSKYYPNSSFWTAPNNSTKSIFWSSIMQIKHVLHEHCVLQIHYGDSSIWSSPWCAVCEFIHDHIKLLITVQRLPNKIADFGCLSLKLGQKTSSPESLMIKQQVAYPLFKWFLRVLLTN